MTSWMEDLSEFELTYQNKGLMKSQFLAYFLTQLRIKGKQLAWRSLSVCGSSNKKNSGVDIILEGPNNLILEHAIHFSFNMSNNQAI